MKYKIPLAKPDISDLEKKMVLRVLNTSELSLGPKVKEFEKKIAKFVGVKHAIAVNSGTSALHLIIRALGIREGDQVITSPFSFIASANCILFEGAKPVFVDIKPDSFNINPVEIEKKITKKTKAILAVDIFGVPAEWDKLKKIAKKHRLYLIEDSAEALGSEYKGKKCGSFGDAAVFGFYPNKQITTGEGGVVLTNNKRIADLCRSMANQGRKIKKGGWLEHERLGYNYRISDINCALGLAQLSRIKELLEKRKKIAKIYEDKLKSFPEVRPPDIDGSEVKISPFVYTIRLKEKYSEKERDRIIKKMLEKDIQCGVYFPPIHLQPFYRKMFSYKSGDFPVTENVAKRVIALPFFNDLETKEINYIVKNLKKIISKIK